MTTEERLKAVEERGVRLRRRRDKIESDIAFLSETMLTNAAYDMQPQRNLLKEWEEELEEIDQCLAGLREEWLKLRNQGETPPKIINLLNNRDYDRKEVFERLHDRGA